MATICIVLSYQKQIFGDTKPFVDLTLWSEAME